MTCLFIKDNIFVIIMENIFPFVLKLLLLTYKFVIFSLFLSNEWWRDKFLVNWEF